MRHGRFTKVLCAVIAFAAGFLIRDDLSQLPRGNAISQAEARVIERHHHRHIPVTAHGVARRTARRTIRRTAIFVAALPPGCRVVHYNGLGYHQCGSRYYQSSGGRYVQVTVH